MDLFQRVAFTEFVVVTKMEFQYSSKQTTPALSFFSR